MNLEVVLSFKETSVGVYLVEKNKWWPSLQRSTSTFQIKQTRLRDFFLESTAVAKECTARR
jgi:hypothetical protein